VGALAAGKLGSGIDLLVATGDFVPALAELAGDGRVVAVEDPLEAYESLRPLLAGDETVLLKGSRGVALERLLPLLERDFAGAPDRAPDTAHAGA
jgi:UDP-N-acetylmuramoyl-tripeptide--D-alanyl-D-alanine ligase